MQSFDREFHIINTHVFSPNTTFYTAERKRHHQIVSIRPFDLTNYDDKDQ
jgi:hypothetical protein